MNRDSDPMRAAALAPALPPEVERDAETGKITGGSAAADTKDRNLMRQVLEEAEHQRHAKCRAHIATLTRERDEARAAYRSVAAACSEHQREARADALRWVLDRGGYVTYPLECEIHAELARLDAGEGVERGQPKPAAVLDANPERFPEAR